MFSLQYGINTAPKIENDADDSLLAIMPNPLENYESSDEEIEPLMLAITARSASDADETDLDETVIENVPIAAVVSVKNAHKESKTSRYGRKIVKPDRLTIL